jgi:hypothetical protein
MINETGYTCLRRFASTLIDENRWPSHLINIKPNENSTEEEIRKSLREYLIWSKGTSSVAEIISDCSIEEMPISIKEVIARIKLQVESDGLI